MCPNLQNVWGNMPLFVFFFFVQFMSFKNVASVSSHKLIVSFHSFHFKRLLLLEKKKRNS